MAKFDNNMKKCRNAETQTHKDAETKHATQRCKMQHKPQDTMQDAVCDEHEQMEMLMPPKVLHCKHNH